MTYDLKVERLIDASPAEVFDAYTDPEAQRVWFTILNKDMMVETDVDLRVGGKSVITWGFSPDEMFRETNSLKLSTLLIVSSRSRHTLHPTDPSSRHM